MQQRYTSERTCRHSFPALHRALLDLNAWRRGDTNADIGGGCYELVTERLADIGVLNIVWDPHNREDEHNAEALRLIKMGTTTATVAKVINVIMEPEIRADVIRLAARARVAYFHVYEGDGSGVGKETRDGWQENRKLLSYVSEIEPFFGHVAVTTISGVRVIEAR
jgi:hypothetical protein